MEANPNGSGDKLPKNGDSPKAGPPPLQVPVGQTTPWEPVIDKQSTSDERTAAAEYTAIYGGSPASSEPADSGPGLGSSYSIPNVSMAYSTAPSLVPTKPAAASGQSQPIDGATIDAMPAVHIDLVGHLEAEQSCLNYTKNAVDAYQALQPQITNATTSDNFFGQIAGYHVTVKGNQPNMQQTKTDYDKADQGAQKFAGTMIPQLEYLMQQAGGLLELMGTFCALWNNAGQMYTDTDASSALE